MIFEGYYKSGNKLYPIPNKKQFWEERDSNGNLCRISQFDADVKYNGLSYQYHNNQITRVSRWEDDKEIETMKLFNNGIMTEIKNGKKTYEGEYNNSIESNYQREGEGEEYDNDGDSLLYKGSFKNGKRNGQGKLYQYGNIVYDGEWIEGMQRTHFLLFTGLILALVMISTTEAYYYGNVYVATYLIGIYATALCFYLNKYAGYVASALLLIMIGFFIHLIAGIVISVVIAIAAIYYINVFAGVIPVGMILIAIFLHFNIYLGLFAISLFMIYIMFLIVYYLEWPTLIIMFGTGGILFTCILTCLVIGLMVDSTWKYFVIALLIGLLFMYMVIVFKHYLKWEKDAIYLSIGGIILYSLNVFIIYGSMKIEVIKYLLVFAIGAFIFWVIYALAYYLYWKNDVLYTYAGMILFACIIIGMIIGFDDNKRFRSLLNIFTVICAIMILWTLIAYSYISVVNEVIFVLVAFVFYIIVSIMSGSNSIDRPTDWFKWVKIGFCVLLLFGGLVDIIQKFIEHGCKKGWRPALTEYLIVVYITLTIAITEFMWALYLWFYHFGLCLYCLFLLCTSSCDDCDCFKLFLAFFIFEMCTFICWLLSGFSFFFLFLLLAGFAWCWCVMR